MTAVTLVLLCVGSADAVVQHVPGRRLSLLQRPGRERAVFVAKSPAIVRPFPNGGDDPTIVGATLRIVSPGSGEAATFDLPAAQWSTNTSGTRYRFKNPAAPGGPSAVKVALLRDGTIKVTARAPGISLDEPTQGSIGVVLISRV